MEEQKQSTRKRSKCSREIIIEENEQLDEFVDDILTYILESTIIDCLLRSTPQRVESWNIEDVRRHWMLKHHCELLLFPCQYPALPLPSKIGKYFWHIHCTSGKPTPHYKKLIVRCVANAFAFMNVYKPRMTYLIYTDIMFDINWLDYHRRICIMNSIEKIISYQDSLIMVSLECARISFSECIQLLKALGKNCGDTLQRLYLWKAFAPKEILKKKKREQFQPYKGTRIYKHKDYLKTLSLFRNLTVLAVNFAYLTGRDGEALLSLGSIEEGRFKVLQLLCLEEDMSVLTTTYENGEEVLPNSVWKKAQQKCPDMRLYIVICCVPQDNLSRKFLSPSMPLSSFHLSTGIDAQHSLLWHIDVTLRLLASWYPKHLERLYLHLWQNRDILDGMLIDCLSMFPNLKILEFIGILHRETTPDLLCETIIDADNLALKKLRVLVHESPSKDPEDLKEKLDATMEKYKLDFAEINVDMYIGTYRC